MRTILVIDDEFGIAEVLEAVLSDAGYDVLTAVNGQKGLERIAERRPDLILLDFMMPVMDGATLLGILRADASLSRIPVILLSSLPKTAVDKAAAGYSGFLRKPFKIRPLLELISSLLPGA